MRVLALFVVVAGAVAVSTVCAAQEAGIDGGRADPQRETLNLSLSAAERICETERAWRSGVVESYKDEDGNWVEEETIFGWWRIPSVPVRWQVSGGQAPYTLVIDHESADQYGVYEGSSNTAQVGCADASVGTSFWPDEGRMYDVDPKVDSGWKTITGVVTDANGATAKATVRVYVILATSEWEHVLRAGETYRIHGRLFTVPDGVDMRVGEYSTSGSGTQSFVIEGHESAEIVLDARTYEELHRRLPPSGAQGTAGVDLDTKFDEFVDSIDKLPDFE